MIKATVSDTICALAVDEPLEAQPIDPPTITVTFGINDSLWLDATAKRSNRG